MRRHYLFILFCLLLISFAAVSNSLAQDTSIDLERIQRATVYVMQVRTDGSGLLVQCISSGTLISRDGLILTNAHSTVSSSSCSGDTLFIAMGVRTNEPPVIQYQADLVQYDVGLDLAILRITRELDGRAIVSESLSLPFVEVSDATQTQIDDTITVVGFPGIGNDPVAVVRGIVTGFVYEPRNIEGPSWIKTSGEIPGTMSGGGVYNQQSQLIGIPTTAPINLRENTSTQCSAIQDTNSDGLINDVDYCIPTGVFINALRPADYALPLIRAALLSLTVSNLSESPNSVASTQEPTFSRLLFSPSINDANMATTVVSSLPAGSSSLYLFFDYNNMTPETVYELRVTINGIPSPIFSLAPVRWSGGSNGMWYMGSTGQIWPNGVYEFALFVNGITNPESTQRLTIGEAPGDQPVVSDIVFGLFEDDIPLGTGYVLPTGNIATARFLYRNMQDGMSWTAIWYRDGLEVERISETWSRGNEGSSTTSIQSPSGIPPGTYRLSLYVNERLAATADLIIAGGRESVNPLIFSDLYFTSAENDSLARTAPPISNFPETISNLYGAFDWQQIERGTLWNIRWLVDGEPFFEHVAPWTSDPSGQDYLMRLTAPDGIPDGTYTIEIRINNVRLVTAQAQVGIGQLPIDEFAQADGVQLTGQILDADTQQGIAGVTVVIISDQFSTSDFIWLQDQIFSIAITDRNGLFEVERPLQLTTEDRSIAYSLLIAADGYLPISADGIEVTETTPNPLNLIIYLTKD
jgi:hypothetical protein